MNNMSTAIIATAGSFINKIGFQLKKHSPEILAVTGTIGVVVSAVLACKATTKVSDILEDTKDQVDDVHRALEGEKYADEYTEEDSKKDLVIIYTKAAMNFVKLYAPSVALGVLSIGCMLASNNILRKRNVALAAAYATIDKGFKEYRSRVVERFGEAVDRELKYNIKAQKITETVTDPETGKEKQIKKTVDVFNPDEYSSYARFFDECSPYWEKNAEMNLMFLRGQQKYANQMLISKGHVFLNEVYDMLGIPRTKAGQVVGWVYDGGDNPTGDDYITFGIYDGYRETTRDFVNGYERSILLDFNVDGDILNRLETHIF